MSVQRFTDMLSALFSIQDDATMEANFKLVVSRYKTREDFRGAIDNNKTAFLGVVADRFTTSLAIVIFKNFPNYFSDQEIWDAFIVGKTGQELIDSAFRLLNILYNVGRVSKAAELATYMLQRIEQIVDDESRVSFMLVLASSLRSQPHLDALIASQAWADMKVVAPSVDDEAKGYVDSITKLEARSSTPTTIELLEQQAASETNPEKKFDLLLRAQQMTES